VREESQSVLRVCTSLISGLRLKSTRTSAASSLPWRKRPAGPTSRLILTGSITLGRRNDRLVASHSFQRSRYLARLVILDPIGNASFGPNERRSGNEGGPREPETRARRRMAEGIFGPLPFAGHYRQGSACPSLPRGPRPRSHDRKKTYSPYETERRGAEEIITNSVQIARNWQVRPSREGWRLSPIAVARLLVDPASDGNAEPMRLARVRGL
jgi:hypothetical protein